MGVVKTGSSAESITLLAATEAEAELTPEQLLDKAVDSAVKALNELGENANAAAKTAANAAFQKALKPDGTTHVLKLALAGRALEKLDASGLGELNRQNLTLLRDKAVGDTDNPKYALIQTAIRELESQSDYPDDLASANLGKMLSRELGLSVFSDAELREGIDDATKLAIKKPLDSNDALSKPHISAAKLAVQKFGKNTTSTTTNPCSANDITAANTALITTLGKIKGIAPKKEAAQYILNELNKPENTTLQDNLNDASKKALNKAAGVNQKQAVKHTETAAPDMNLTDPKQTLVVSKNETLSGIAKELGVKLQDLKAANPQLKGRAAEGSYLYTGETLIVPASAKNAAKSDRVKSQNLVLFSGGKDEFRALAKKHGLTVKQLTELNSFMTNSERNIHTLLSVGGEVASPVLKGQEPPKKAKVIDIKTTLKKTALEEEGKKLTKAQINELEDKLAKAEDARIKAEDKFKGFGGFFRKYPVAGLLLGVALGWAAAPLLAAAFSGLIGWVGTKTGTAVATGVLTIAGMWGYSKLWGDGAEVEKLRGDIKEYREELNSVQQQLDAVINGNAAAYAGM